MLVAVIFLATVLSAESWEEKCPGDPGYVETWTKNFWSLFNIFTNEEHVRVGQNGDYVQMQLDEQCAAVYGSRHQYYTGRMSVKLKLPCGNSSGTVFAFYTSSDGKKPYHDEIDIELLGNETSSCITMQTNIFVNGKGDREMRHNLNWFNPCDDYHEYYILWNSAMVVIGVDDIPIRVFKNNEQYGLPYFNKGQGLYVSYWDGSSWATQGGRIKIDFALNGPFVAHMHSFHDLQGCQVPSEDNIWQCQYPAQRPCWDRPWVNHYLTQQQIWDYNWVNGEFCTYDYCKDVARFAATGKPAECNLPRY